MGFLLAHLWWNVFRHHLSFLVAEVVHRESTLRSGGLQASNDRKKLQASNEKEKMWDCEILFRAGILKQMRHCIGQRIASFFLLKFYIFHMGKCYIQRCHMQKCHMRKCLCGNVTCRKVTCGNVTCGNVTCRNRNVTFGNVTCRNVTYRNVTFGNVTCRNVTCGNYHFRCWDLSVALADGTILPCEVPPTQAACFLFVENLRLLLDQLHGILHLADFSSTNIICTEGALSTAPPNPSYPSLPLIAFGATSVTDSIFEAKIWTAQNIVAHWCQT